ncbi:MAG: hypothetical protein ABJG47_10925 [Ekhidna sp.]
MKLILALLPLTLIGCLPNRLVPYDYSIEKDNREAYIELDSITVAISNLAIKGDHFVFGMEIENKSTQPIFIDVNSIQKYSHRLSYGSKNQVRTYQEVTSAMTPSRVNQFFKSKRNQAEAASFLLFLVGAAVSTADAIKDHSDNNKKHWTHDDAQKSRNRDIATSATLVATDILNDIALQNRHTAETELDYLPKELFTRKVIYPGESYYGKVLFERVGMLNNYHRLALPFEQKRLLFDFRKATSKEKQFLHRR